MPVPMPMPALDWKRAPATALAEGGAIALEWDRLNGLRLNLPFLSAASMAAALSAFGRGDERLLIGSQGTRVVAMLVLVPQGRWRWATFQPSQMPLGAWVADAALGLGEIARSLLEGPLRRCLVLSITQVDPRMAPREADTATARHSDYIDTGWIDVQGSFEQYWAERGKNLRQNLRKQRNKLAAEGVQTRMLVLTAPDDMAPALERYGALESAGWKAGQGTAIHADNAQGRFYRALLENAAQRGEAVVYEYRFDDRTVAMDLCLLRHGELIVLKTTYDESIKLFSPAFLMREEELRILCGHDTVRRVEFYGRLMEWHTRWTDNKRTLYHMTLYRWPLLMSLAHLRRKRQPGSAEHTRPHTLEPGP